MRNNKRGVVLFATILFILAISLLIVKNLEITDQFLQISTKNVNIKQLEISIKDINREILNLFKDKDSALLDDMPPTIPFSYGNVEVVLELESYTKQTYKLDKNLGSKTDDYFNSYIDRNSLLSIIKDLNITNQKQVDYVIEQYIDKTNDRKILEIKDNLTYFDLNNSKRYISCKYDINIDGLEAKVDMVFEPNTKKIATPIKLDILIKN